MRSMRMRLLALAVPACALLLTGCGGGPIQEEQIQQVFDDYVQAVKHKDVDAFCDSIASNELARMSKEQRAKEVTLCKDDFSAKDFGDDPDAPRDTELTEITVKGNRATAKLATVKDSKQSAKTRFVSLDGKWKVLFESR